MRRLVMVCLVVLLLPGLAAAKELKPYSGKPLPDFTLTDMDGKSHTLSDYKGQVVMVNFWATYCTPCIKEMPSMERLRVKMAGLPFTILAIDMAETPEEVSAFFNRHKIDIGFPILLDPEGGVIEQWRISAIPTTFIVAPDGTIRYALFGGLEWDSLAVQKSLKALLPK